MERTTPAIPRPWASLSTAFFVLTLSAAFFPGCRSSGAEDATPAAPLVTTNTATPAPGMEQPEGGGHSHWGTPQGTPTATPLPGVLKRDDLLLPDLQISVPEELYIQYGADGVREIRFSTHIINAGAGPLQMVGEVNAESGEILTTQQIHTGAGDIVENTVGQLVFHEEHDHWHLDSFMVFELWALEGDDGLGELITSTGKMTFCLADSYPMDEPGVLPAEKALFTGCGQHVQGISNGWVDVYHSQLAGQFLSIPDLPDGRYAVRSAVDPDGIVIEADTTNNDSVAIVNIAGTAISIEA